MWARHHGDLHIAVGGLALDCQPDLRANRPAQLTHRVLLADAGGRVAVDRDDHVLIQKAGDLGRRVLHDREHLDAFVDHADAHPDAAKAVPARPVLARLLSPGVARVIVQLGDQTAENGLVDRFRLGGVEQLGLAAPGFDRGGCQLAPSLHVPVIRFREAGGLPAVHLEAQMIVANVHVDCRVDARKAVQAGQGHLGNFQVFYIDITDILISDGKNLAGPRVVVLRRVVGVLGGAGGGQEGAGDTQRAQAAL